MKFIDLFAGIGGFHEGMTRAGHECVGFCEYDRYAVASYTSMYLITEEQREYLATLPLKQRQQEILKEEYRNGMWYRQDVRTIEPGDVPRADIWCFGAPCQDFSIANGRRTGLEGDRSSLVGQVFRLINEISEEVRPEWLVYENVAGMLSSNGGKDYLAILSEMDRLGYDAEWQNINSKWFVPQNRERIYTVGHLRIRGGSKIFPLQGADEENSIHGIEQVGMLKSDRYNPNQYRVYDTGGIAPTLSKMDGGGREPHIVAPNDNEMKIIGSRPSGGQRARIMSTDSIHPALSATDYKQPVSVAIPVLTPDIGKKNQNGRRLKEDGDPSFTLTAKAPQGVAVLGGFGEKKSNSGTQWYQQDRVYDGCGIATSLNSQLPGGGQMYGIPSDEIDTVYYPKRDCYIAIRKLTPKECFRLQGFSDDLFSKAQFVNSDSQLYKQAGNAVTVNAAEAVGRAIADNDSETQD